MFNTTTLIKKLEQHHFHGSVGRLGLIPDQDLQLSKNLVDGLCNLIKCVGRVNEIHLEIESLEISMESVWEEIRERSFDLNGECLISTDQFDIWLKRFLDDLSEQKS